MRRPDVDSVLRLTCLSLNVGGCMRHAKTPAASSGVDTVHYAHLAHHIEVPEGSDTANDPLMSTPQPTSLTSLETQDYLEMSLEEAMQLALLNSKVMKDLGATVLRAPDTVRSVNDPSLVETDGRFGIEAALSAFDAQFTTSTSIEHNNRALNNVFFGGGTRLLRQDFSVWQTQLSKISATGPSTPSRTTLSTTPITLRKRLSQCVYDLDGYGSEAPLAAGSGDQVQSDCGTERGSWIRLWCRDRSH